MTESTSFKSTYLTKIAPGATTASKPLDLHGALAVAGDATGLLAVDEYLYGGVDVFSISHDAATLTRGSKTPSRARRAS
jgi:hypothetical protein